MSEMGWQRLKASGSGPGTRLNPIAICDQDRLLVCGGRRSMDGPGYPMDLYVFDLQQKTWTIAQTRGTPPSPRCGSFVMVVGRRMLLFGGFENTPEESIATAVQDTTVHALDLDTLTWRTLRVEGKPPSPRWGIGGALDGKKVWMYGGDSDWYTPHSEMFVLELTGADTARWSSVEMQKGDLQSPMNLTCVGLLVQDGHLIRFMGHGGYMGIPSETWIAPLPSGSDPIRWQAATEEMPEHPPSWIRDEEDEYDEWDDVELTPVHGALSGVARFPDRVLTYAPMVQWIDSHDPTDTVLALHFPPQGAVAGPWRWVVHRPGGAEQPGVRHQHATLRWRDAMLVFGGIDEDGEGDDTVWVLSSCA